MAARPVIALLTDFGLCDAFVGTMKGVILSRCPQAQIVDLTHDLPPQDVRAGAFHLWSAYRYFPKGALFVCVVDPGVGSARRIIAVKSARYRFLAPDNGLLSWTLQAEGAYRAVSVENCRIFLPAVSATFHGRDIFAPCAAYWAGGGSMAGLGPRVGSLRRLPLPCARRQRGIWRGEVLIVDRFGNLITNFPLTMARPAEFRIARRRIPCAGRYAAVAPGKLMALPGSSGFWEIALRNGSAARRLQARPGSLVWARA
jgi:hypothetical protein